VTKTYSLTENFPCGFGMQYTKFWYAVYKVLVCCIQSFGIQYTKLWYAVYKVLVCSIQSFGMLYTKFWCAVYKVLVRSVQSFGMQYTKDKNHYTDANVSTELLNQRTQRAKGF
jgi:hypothetical protein